MSYGDFVILRMVPFYADSVEFQLKGTTSCQESDCVEAMSFAQIRFCPQLPSMVWA